MRDIEARLIALVQQHAEAQALWQVASREAQVAGDRCRVIEEQIHAAKQDLWRAIQGAAGVAAPESQGGNWRPSLPPLAVR